MQLQEQITSLPTVSRNAELVFLGDWDAITAQDVGKQNSICPLVD